VAFPVSSSSPLPSPLIKLTDFGLSRFIDPARPWLTTRCGSEAYAAPELVIGGSGEGGWRGYDARETDAWACGVVLYAVACRRLPFGEGPDVDGQRGGGGGAIGREERGAASGRGERERSGARRAWLSRIARGEWEWPKDSVDNAGVQGELMSAQLSRCAGLRRIVGRLLVRDTRKRAKVADVLEDEWVRGGNGNDEGRALGARKKGGWAVGGVEGALDDDDEEWLVDREGIESVACQEVL
jgi:protein-serine/threonine kinase